MYNVVTTGVTKGFCTDEVKPGGIEVHDQVYLPDPPVAVTFNCEDCPLQISGGVADPVRRNGFAKLNEAMRLLQADPDVA
jgi:hypothetical protein